MLAENQKLFLDLVKSGLTGTGTNVFLPSPDWGLIEQYCFTQAVPAVVYEGLRLMNGQSIDMGFSERLENNAIRAELETLRKLEVQKKLLSISDSVGVAPLFLKGIVMCRYYPRPQMRAMSDIDMIVPFGSDEKLVTALVKNGYTTNGKPIDGQVQLLSPENVACEVHTKLFGDNFPYSKVIASFFTYEPEQIDIGGIKPAIMNPQDLFYHVSIHAAKHYLNSEMNLRMICDLSLLIQRHQEQLDFSAIWQNFKACKLDRIISYLTKICRQYLGLVVTNKTLANLLDQYDYKMLDTFIDDVLSNNVYKPEDGSGLAVSKLSFALGKDGKNSKAATYWYALFPLMNAMKIDYPPLRTKPWLYPYFCVYRWFKVLGMAFGKDKGFNIAAALKGGKEKRKLLEYFEIVD